MLEFSRRVELGDERIREDSSVVTLAKKNGISKAQMEYPSQFEEPPADWNPYCD